MIDPTEDDLSSFADWYLNSTTLESNTINENIRYKYFY